MSYKFKYLIILLAIMYMVLIVGCGNKNIIQSNDYNYEALYNTWHYSEINNDTLVFRPEGYELPPILPSWAFTFYKPVWKESFAMLAIVLFNIFCVDVIL